MNHFVLLLEVMKKTKIRKELERNFFGTFNGSERAEDMLSVIEEIMQEVIDKAEDGGREDAQKQIEEELLNWYSDRQVERGIRAWTDDFFSEGDTLSGTIIPIIRSFKNKPRKKNEK